MKEEKKEIKLCVTLPGVWQLTPENPAEQVHVYPETGAGEQTPPLRHGLLSHKSETTEVQLSYVFWVF